MFTIFQEKKGVTIELSLTIQKKLPDGFNYKFTEFKGLHGTIHFEHFEHAYGVSGNIIKLNLNQLQISVLKQ